MVIQHDCENSMAMSQPWGQAPLQLGSSGVVHSAPCTSASSSKNAVLSCPWKGKVCFLRQRGAGFYGQKSPPLVPGWSVLMQRRTTNPCNLIGPKGTVLIGQNRAIHWLELCSSDWMGKTSVLLVEIGLQGLLYRGWLRWQTHSVGRQFIAGFSLKCGLHEKPLCRNDYYALFFVCFYFIF